MLLFPTVIALLLLVLIAQVVLIIPAAGRTFLLRVLLVAVTIATGVIAAIELGVAQRAAAATRAWRRSLARSGVLLDALGLFGIALAGTLPLALRTC